MDGNPDTPLEIRGLVKAYGDVTAVAGVSLTVAPGTVFCLLGPNGAGKTTTLECAQGLRRPTSGTVRVFGADPLKAPPALKRRVGVLPQLFATFETMTVEENLRYFADIYDARPDIPALLADMSLTPHARHQVHTLSGGTRRRVGIAMAMVSDPDLLFLDEPTAGVDPANRRHIWALVRSLKAQGRSIVLTTHYMDEAERLADEVAIIQKGRIVAHGTPETVRRQHGGRSVIRISGLEGPLPAAIADRPGVLQDADGTLTIPLQDVAEGPEVIAALVGSGVPYKALSILEPNLDDAFVRIVDAGA